MNFKHSNGFTAVDNKIFYLQEILSPSAFSVLIRVYRMTEGYDGNARALSNGFFQKTCNISKNTVTKAIKELVELKILLTKKRARATTYYQINPIEVDNIYNRIQKDASINLLSTEGVVEDRNDVDVAEDLEKKEDSDFKEFWNTYDKKVNKFKCEEVWGNLTQEDKKLILHHIGEYVKSTPDKQFRKDPLTYLTKKSWQDEIVQYKVKSDANPSNSKQKPSKESPDEYKARLQRGFDELFS